MTQIWYTSAEAAEFLGYANAATLRACVRQGSAPAPDDRYFDTLSRRWASRWKQETLIQFQRTRGNWNGGAPVGNKNYAGKSG